jgi:hypothetical protein
MPSIWQLAAFVFPPFDHGYLVRWRDADTRRIRSHAFKHPLR